MLPALNQKSNNIKQGYFILLYIIIFMFAQVDFLFGQSLDIPVKGYGISFGNSKKFAGLRINFRDRRVDRIDGINVTLWKADENEDAIMRGISVGIMPEAGDMGYLQFGIAGVAAGAFTYIKGLLRGVSLGIVNYAYEVNGIQIGLVNYVADNPSRLKILPLFNTSF